MKEVKSGEVKFNYVYIKMKSNKLSVEEAVDQVVGEANECMRLSLEYGENLKAFNNKSLNKYVQACIACMYGCMYWHATLRRYNQGYPKFFDDNIFVD